MNTCVECGRQFEPDGDHWIHCPECQRKRARDRALVFDRILRRFQDDPDVADLRLEIKETRNALVKDIL